MEDISLIVSICVGIAAIFSPMAVAHINNRHAKEMRLLEIAHSEEVRLSELHHSEKLRLSEFSHSEKMREIECSHDLEKEQLSISYNAKSESFTNLVSLLSDYFSNPNDKKLRSQLYSAIYTASMYCSDTRVQETLSTLRYSIEDNFSENDLPSSINRFVITMDNLAYALHFELSGDELKQEDE